MNDSSPIARVMHHPWFGVASNVALALVFTHFAVRHVAAYQIDPNPLYLMYVTMEALVVAFVLSRKQPIERSARPATILAALAGTFLPLVYAPNGQVLTYTVGVLLGFVGSAFAVLSYLSLNTSFGITPALRSVKERGMYAFVRHPMYLSYLPLQVGYLLTNFSVYNASVFALIVVAQLTRIRYEEALLLRDPAYVRYAARVRYRLIPYVY